MKPLPLFMSFLVGTLIASAFFIVRDRGTLAPLTESRELHEGQSDLINPLLDCPAASTALPPKHAEVEDAIRDTISRVKAQGGVDFVSVYFRDLNNGPAFGVDSSVPFSTASLLKVPVMIGYFKKLESTPGFFDQTIFFQAKKHELRDVSQTIEPPEPLKDGQAYPIGFLISRMITLSDNTAASMLLQEHPEIDVVAILKDMGVKLAINGNDATLSVSAYASIFRILYNATYLNRENSRKALQLLAQSHMSKGLVMGVEPGTPVAHKFGERENEGLSQFHDCGIIYASTRPYLLCVMTRGRQKMPPLISTVTEISKIVFQKMKNH